MITRYLQLLLSKSGARLAAALLILLASEMVYPGGARAQGDDPFGFDSSLNVYTESPYSKLPLQSVSSVTRIDGPIAKSHIVYTFVDGMKQTMEVGLNFRLPAGAILNGFGYYYGTRFIPGVIYTNDQAWQIYTAVTSRGRDPGIMDRPEQQDYHTQIYPVLPGQYLRVVIDLTQLLPTDAEGAHFTLPLQQDNEVTRPAQINAEVAVIGHRANSVQTSFAGYVKKSDRTAGCVAHLSGNWLPKDDWEVTIRPESSGIRTACYSRLSSGRYGGAYAATIAAPFALRDARISIAGRTDTDLTLATAFGDRERYAPISFVGRYRRPGTAYVTVHSSNHRPFTVRLKLGSAHSYDPDNAAAKIWADKRITAIENDTSRDRRSEVVGLSKRYTVVSTFTALLAIPQEELENYRRRLAAHKVSTNTDETGGGGGDPYISVKAPEDAQQVVAVFPTGDARELTYDTVRGVWDGRFDIPFDTPEGDYRVTVIVVHKDGNRTQFLLTYHNSLSAPQIDSAVTLTAQAGEPVRVRVQGHGIARAVAVAPWGERIDLTAGGDGAWSGTLKTPADWPSGTSTVSVVVLDGAHNRTEVTLDLDVK